MRRRQLMAQRECLIHKEVDMGTKVPNSNLISKNASAELKEKASMFLPNENDIVKPNGTPFRKKGSKPGPGAYDKTIERNKY